MDKVAVLFLIFNREDHAVESFKMIQEYKPSRLYIAADGPRPEKAGEDLLCQATRDIILSAVNWNCEIKTLFRGSNLGLTSAVSEAITWFFETEEFGIIIEDDVVISQDFFHMCEELLPYYKTETRIMQISAQNHSGKYFESNKYTFNKRPEIWGWATWRRAWNRMDLSMSKWPSFHWWNLIKYYGLFQSLMMLYYWNSVIRDPEKAGSWDTRWHFSIVISDGICILPMVNLARNIGTNGGTHYEKEDKDPYINLRIGSLRWPLEYCSEIKLDTAQMKCDNQDFKRVRRIGLMKKFYKIISFK